MRELNPAAASAGVTAFIWYACGALPLQLALAGALGLSTGSVFIVWASGGVASIVLSLRLKQPVPITWSIPALVYVASLAGRFGAAEIAGATLVSALLLAAVVLARGGSRLMKWLPMPIVMATFAGGLLEYMQRAVAATLADVLIAGSVVAGYLAARLVASPRLPPVGAALVAGSLAVALQGSTGIGELAWSLPALEVSPFRFDPAAIAAISVPLVVFALGLGNAQGLGFLEAQGYDVPVDRVSRAVAIGSLINELRRHARRRCAGVVAAGRARKGLRGPAALRRAARVRHRRDALQPRRHHFGLLGPGGRSARLAPRQGTGVARRAFNQEARTLMLFS
jgi:benzoate membrane transport protein